MDFAEKSSGNQSMAWQRLQAVLKALRRSTNRFAHCTHSKDDTHKTRCNSAFSVMHFNSQWHEYHVRIFTRVRPLWHKKVSVFPFSLCRSRSECPNDSGALPGAAVTVVYVLRKGHAACWCRWKVPLQTVASRALVGCCCQNGVCVCACACVRVSALERACWCRCQGVA